MPETGIEPVRVLPRRILSPVRLPVPPLGHMVGEGFGPSKLSQQIYSLPPLATREPNHNIQSKL